jgi:hypothetical protein
MSMKKNSNGFYHTVFPDDNDVCHMKDSEKYHLLQCIVLGTQDVCCLKEDDRLELLALLMDAEKSERSLEEYRAKKEAETK